MKILQALGLRRFFAIIAVFLALMSIISCVLLVVSTTRLYKNTSRMAEAVESIHIAGQLEIKLLIHNRESFLWQTTGKQEHYEKKEQGKVELYSLLEKSKRFIGSPVEEKVIEELERAIGNYFSDRYFLEAEKTHPIEAYNKISPALNKAFLLTEELTKLNRIQTESLQQRTHREDRLANTAGVSIALFVLLLVFLFLLVIKRLLYDPIIHLRNTISDFSPSNYAVKAEENGPKEIKEIVKTFNNMAERIAKQRESQYKFLASIAHDLKNPISAIALSSQFLSGREIEVQTKNMIEVIRRQSGQLNRMVEDLLDTARIEAGRLELKKKRENITAIIKDSIDLYKSTSTIHEFHFSAPEHPIFCMIDSVRMSQVINNFMSNAIKYSPARRNN